MTKSFWSLQHLSEGVGPMATACLKSISLILAIAGPLVWNCAMKGRHIPVTSCLVKARHVSPAVQHRTDLRLFYFALRSSVTCPMAIACLKSTRVILTMAGPFIWKSAVKGRCISVRKCFINARHLTPAALIESSQCKSCYTGTAQLARQEGQRYSLATTACSAAAGSACGSP